MRVKGDGDVCAGKRRKGSLKWRWMDIIKHDLTEKDYRAKMPETGLLGSNYRLHIKVGKDADEETVFCIEKLMEHMLPFVIECIVYVSRILNCYG